MSICINFEEGYLKHNSSFCFINAIQSRMLSNIDTTIKMHYRGWYYENYYDEYHHCEYVWIPF